MRFLVAIMVLVLALPAPAEAANRNQRRPSFTAHARTPAPSPAAPEMFHPNKYAALVMDAKTGEILHARNADAVRYPASLTKMMTLYLLFDALDKKKISLRSTMPVSRTAAAQPQTNISLRVGDRVPVDTAIRALIVRSANDVAVVVGERLGGSVSGFASMMNAKARQLGMKHTQFRNPHGLPDAAQRTTARDMAKLAVALRRDFPQYYNYFAVRQFSWKRASYYTHNRVMLRYAGADGIKTGFINASGFNIVTSVRRNGRQLIGVVFGGNNAAARDDRMIALIEQAEARLAARGTQMANIQPANLPNPITPPAPRQPVASTPAAQPVSSPAPATAAPPATTPPPASVAQAPASAPIAQVQSAPPAPAQAPQSLPFATKAESDARYASLRAANVMSEPEPEVARWGIQVGAFEERAQADQAVRKAYALAGTSLQGAQMAVAGAGASGKTIHRARLENINENQARSACQTLISHRSPCFIYRVN